MSLNGELARIFETLASVSEIKGENVFKAISFRKIARLLDDLAFDARSAVESGTLASTEGVGPGSRKIIEEFVRTGRSTDYDEAVASVPSGLLTLLQIPSLGPKTISLLWKQRGVTNIEELTKAIDTGALEGLKGIGEKKIAAIKTGIAMLSQAAGRVDLPDADAVGETLVERLRAMKPVKQADIAGSLRRRRETIGDVDLVCCVIDPAKASEVAAAFVAFPEVQHVNGQGTTKASVVTAGGLQVDLRIVPEENYGAALLYFSGSKDHGKKIRGLALDQDMTLNEWGLYDLAAHEKAAKKTGEPPALKPLASRTEADVYKKLGMAYVEPELREDRGEVEAARAKTLPLLVSAADYRGDLHTHTTASDGVATIEQMAEAAIARGYAYLAVTDHSKSQVIANGLTAERLLKHVKAIHKVRDRLRGEKFLLLAGCEVDILVDGRLDFEADVLAELDVVVASPHVSLSQDAAKATDRMVRAIETDYVNIIGHPTGRLINRRPGLPLDFARVFKAAAATGTALEINAGYPRLDLNELHARAAVTAGCKLAIDTDAHSTGELAALKFGIGVARRAWVRPADVINCLPPDDLMKFIARKRPR